MRIEMEQHGKKAILKCRYCPCEDLVPKLEDVAVLSGLGADFIQLQATCNGCKKPILFRWTNSVTLREVV
jgi:hypothetical protein